MSHSPTKDWQWPEPGSPEEAVELRRLLRMSSERTRLVAFARQVKEAGLVTWGSERLAALQKEAAALVDACDKTDRAP